MTYDLAERIFMAVNWATLIIMLVVFLQSGTLAIVSWRKKRYPSVTWFLVGVAAWSFSVVFNSAFWLFVSLIPSVVPGWITVDWHRVLLSSLYLLAQLGPGVGIYLIWRRLVR